MIEREKKHGENTMYLIFIKGLKHIRYMLKDGKLRWMDTGVSNISEMLRAWIWDG